MSIVKNFFHRVIGSGKEQPKRLLDGTDGNLFHTLILAYIRIYLQNQETKTNQNSSKHDKKSSSSKKDRKSSKNGSHHKGGSNEEESESLEQDPTAVLLSILTIMPKIPNDKLEDDCIASDLLQFLKIICHQFTYNILTIDDQQRIGFNEPHLLSPSTLPTPVAKQKEKKKKGRSKASTPKQSNDSHKTKKLDSGKKRISSLLSNKKHTKEAPHEANNNNDNIHPSMMRMYANDPKRNILADEHYLNDDHNDAHDEEHKQSKKTKRNKKQNKPPRNNQIETKEDAYESNYDKAIIEQQKKNDTLPSPALKRGRIVHHLTAHPSKAPFGALLSAFEQLLDSSNKYFIRCRVDVLNQYGCMASCICKLLHILSPREWDENETPQFKDVILKLKQRLLKFFLILAPFTSTTLELVRSRQLQQIFSSLITSVNNPRNSCSFQTLDQQTVVCIMMNAIATTKNVQIPDVYNYLHERHHISTLLTVLSTQTTKNLTGVYLASAVTVLTVLRSLLKYSSVVTPLLVIDFREGNGFEVLEQLLVVASSLGDEKHEKTVISNWRQMEEFGLIRHPSLLHCKLELIDMVHELVFMDDGDEENFSDYEFINDPMSPLPSTSQVATGSDGSIRTNIKSKAQKVVTNIKSKASPKLKQDEDEQSDEFIDLNTAPKDYGGQSFVKSRAAFRVFERVYSGTSSKWTRITILNRILLILAQAQNVKFIQDLHAIEPLLLRMTTVGNEERQLVIKILEFVITVEDDPPLPELSALKQLLKDASDRDMVSLVLETIRNIVLRKPHYKSAFLHTGVIDVLMDHIIILANHLREQREGKQSVDADSKHRNEQSDDTSSSSSAALISDIGDDGDDIIQNPDIRVWSLSDTIHWFGSIEGGKYDGRFTEVLKKLDFNGQKLLAAEDETLRLELKIEDEEERKRILSHIALMRQKLLDKNSRRELSALVLLDHHDLYVLAMETLLNLLMQHHENGKLFRTKGCHRAVFSLLKSSEHTAAAIKLTRFQTDEESVSDMLSSLHIERDSFEYRINMLEALRQMVSDIQAVQIKNGWHELAGFSTVLSVLASLDSVWKPDEDDQLQKTNNLAYDLINKSFQVIVGVIRNHPRNRAYFWSSGWTSIADAIVLTGVLKNTKHAARVIDVLFGVATEYLIKLQEAKEQLMKPDNCLQPIHHHRPHHHGNANSATLRDIDEMSMFIQNPEAILVILKLVALVSPSLQITVFKKLLGIVNIKLGNTNSEEYLLRNKQLLNNHQTIKHTYEIYEDILNDTEKSPIKDLIGEFLTELGTHCMSPCELNMVLTRAREKSVRAKTLLKYISGEHKFPFFELESYSRTYACIKMSGKFNFFEWTPINKGHSVTCWFNLRIIPPETYLTIFQVLSETQTNVIQVNYSHKGLVFKLGAKYNATFECNDVCFQTHRWYHLSISLCVREVNKKDRKQRRFIFDSTIYINGFAHRNFNHAIPHTTQQTNRDKKQMLHKNDYSYGPFDSLMKARKCKLKIGLDKSHLLHKQCVIWWLGPLFVYHGTLTQSQVSNIHSFAMEYAGIFHPARALAYMQENEERRTYVKHTTEPLPKMAFSFHPHCCQSYSEIKQKLIQSQLNVDPHHHSNHSDNKTPIEEIFSIVGLTTPGAVVKNTSHDMNAPFSHQHPYGYLAGGVTCIRPLAIEDAIRCCGGIENLFEFVARSRTPQQLHEHCALLAAFLVNNPRNLMDMARLGGYEILGSILKEKSHLITLEMVDVICNLAMNEHGNYMKSYLTTHINHTRSVLISDPQRTIYNHVGDAEQSYKSRIHSSMSNLLEETGGMIDNAHTHSVTSSFSALSPAINSNVVLRSYSSELGDNADPSVSAMDHPLIARHGKNILQLPIVIERRYILPDDKGLSNPDRFISEDESMLLSNSLVIKHLILDYQIWCKTSPQIQEALYRWLKDIVVKGPAILTMEFNKLGGLSSSSNTRLLTSLSIRKWNAKRLRDLEIMDDILSVLVHPKVPPSTRKAMFLITQRLLMENFRNQEIELISAFLLHKAFNAEIVLRGQRGIQQAANKQTNKLNNHSNQISSQIQQVMNDGELIVEFMKIFFVYIHNNLLHKRNYDDHMTIIGGNPSAISSKTQSGALSMYSNAKTKSDTAKKIVKAATGKYANNRVLIDTQFDRNFSVLCQIMNIHWFAKFLHQSIGGNVSRAVLCVLNKIMVSDPIYMENSFKKTNGWAILSQLLPYLEPHPRIWIFLFSVLFGLEPKKCAHVSTRPQLPFSSKSLTELFTVVKYDDFQKTYVQHTMRLLFSVIKDYVTLSINGNHNIDTGYCVVAIKFFWQIIKNNKTIREEFISPMPHLEFLVTILFEIAYAKHTRTWKKRGSFNDSATSIYLSQKGLPPLDHVIQSLLTKIFEERIKKHKVYPLFNRVLRAFPSRLSKSSTDQNIQQKLIQLYAVKTVSSCLQRLESVTSIELLLNNGMFVNNIRRMIEICSLTLQNYFSFSLLARKAKSSIKKNKPHKRPKNKPRATLPPKAGVSSLSKKTNGIAQNLFKQGSIEKTSVKKGTSPQPPNKSRPRNRRHSITATNSELRSLQQRRSSVAPSTASSAHPSGSSASRSRPNDNDSILEQIPLPSKMIKRFLILLKACKDAFDKRLQIEDKLTKEKKSNMPTAEDMETLYSVSRKAVQSVVTFFLHGALELEHVNLKNKQLEKILPLVAEFQQILFYTDSNEPDFFFLGLLHVLLPLLSEVVKMGKAQRRNSKGGTNPNQSKYSQQHQRIGTHCLKVWECVLFYQSNFLMKYLHKNMQLYEKLRLIDQDRNAFLKWLQREGLTFTKQTLIDVTKKPWDDCWQTEKALLRQRWEEDLKKNKESNQRAEQYAEALPSAMIQQPQAYNMAILELKHIEDARQNSRRHRIYYRDLRATSAWIHLNFKLRVQSPLWLTTFRTPWDDTWFLNFVEGPHRKRKKLMRHRDFTRMYKVSKSKFFQLLSQHPAFQQYYIEYNSYYEHTNGNKAIGPPSHTHTPSKKPPKPIAVKDTVAKPPPMEPPVQAHTPSIEIENGPMITPMTTPLQSENVEAHESNVQLPVITDEDNPVYPEPMRRKSGIVHPSDRDSNREHRRGSSHYRAQSMSIGTVAENNEALNLARDSAANQLTALESLHEHEREHELSEAGELSESQSLGYIPERSVTQEKKMNDTNDEDDSVYDAADEEEDDDAIMFDDGVSDEKEEVETENDSNDDGNKVDSALDEKFSNLLQQHAVENSRFDDLQHLAVQTTNATSIEDMYKEQKRRQHILKNAAPVTPVVDDVAQNLQLKTTKELAANGTATLTSDEEKETESETQKTTQVAEETKEKTENAAEKDNETDEKEATTDQKESDADNKDNGTDNNNSNISNALLLPNLPHVIKHQASMLQTELPFGTVSDRMARLSISTGVELGLHDRISRVLGPGDDYDPYRTYNCSTITGLDEHGGVILLCHNAMYFFFNICVDQMGKLQEMPYDDTKRGLFTTRFAFKTKVIGPVLAVDKVKQSTYYDPKNPYRPKNIEIQIQEQKDKNDDNHEITHKEPKRWPFTDLREFHRRRYQLQKIAMEFYLHNGSNFLLVFKNNRDRNDFHKKLTAQQIETSNTQKAMDTVKKFSKKNEESKTNDTLKHISAVTDENRLQRAVKGLGSRIAGVTLTEYDTKKVTDRWVKGEMSNFAYLMFLNTLAGRTFNDISQYPVFPWVLKDYESDYLDLRDHSIYRELSKPMGAQTEPRAAEFRERYETYEDPSGEVSKFHYGTHYSCGGIICYFLIRLEPFTRIALELQDGKFDHADRLFSSIAYSYKLASETGGMQDVKELIPEFFYLSNFLVNTNRFDYGTTEKGVAIDDVLLPRWAYGDPERFVRMHRNALESEYVSQNLHKWIDLIFGHKQRGAEAVEAQNVFYPWTYEDAIDLDSITDEVKKTSIIAMIDNFGQTPHQLFNKPHKMREVIKAKITVYSQPSLLQSNLILTAPSKDLPIRFLETTPDLKCVYRGENEIVIGPEYKYTLKWGFSDRSLRVFYKGELVTVFEELVATDSGQITCVLVSDNGSVVFTGDTTSVVNVWKIKTEPRRDKRRPPHATISLRNRLYGHYDEITCLAYSAEYRVIVSGSKDNSLIIWDLNSLQYVHRLEGHTSAIQCVAINANTGDIIAAAGVTISAWTLNGELLAWICCGQSLLTNTITSLAVSCLTDWQPEDSCSVITGHRDGSLRFWALTIPNGSQEIMDNKHIYNNAKVPKNKNKNKSQNKPQTIFENENDYKHYLKSMEKYFKPKLPPYQRRRTNYKSLNEIESHDVPTSDLETSLAFDMKENEKEIKDDEEIIKQSTTIKQLRTDTTLRFKLKHNRKKHSSSITTIHASHYTDQHLWTASSNGEIRQWSLHRSEDHWLNDGDVSNCPKCNSQFGVLERRHHCRKCGNIFCHKCSNNRVDLPDMGYSEPVRVCDFCWERITSSPSQSDVKVTSDTNNIELDHASASNATTASGATGAHSQEASDKKLAQTIADPHLQQTAADSPSKKKKGFKFKK